MFEVKQRHSLPIVPVNISDLFNLRNTQKYLRNSDFELPRFETVRFGRNSIKYMGPHLVEVAKTLEEGDIARCPIPQYRKKIGKYRNTVLNIDEIPTPHSRLVTLT